MGGGSWQGSNRVSGQCGGPGCSNTSQGNWTDSPLSSQRLHGTRRSRAYSAVPPLVNWRVRFSATMRPAMMCDKTCGLNAAKVVVSNYGRYFR